MGTRRQKRSDQQNLPVDGMEGPDPELTRLCEASLDADDEHERTGKLAAEAGEAVKKRMHETGDKVVTVQGITFKTTMKETLTKKGKRSRSEE